MGVDLWAQARGGRGDPVVVHSGLVCADTAARLSCGGRLATGQPSQSYSKHPQIRGGGHPILGAVAGGYCVHGYCYSLDRRLARHVKHNHGQQTEEPAITAIIA